jgi:hypothetical protein
VGKFLNKKGIASSFADDEFLEFRHDFGALYDRLYQFGAGTGRKLINADFVVIGFTAPGMSIFRPVKKDQ